MNQVQTLRIAKPPSSKIKKMMIAVGFEPTPPKRPGMRHPEISGKVTLPWRLRPLGQTTTLLKNLIDALAYDN